MNDKDKSLVLDWLNEIVATPEEWQQFYSSSEQKGLAEKAIGMLKDRPEIVRCGECENHNPNKFTNCGKHYGECKKIAVGVGFYTEDDWYCAYGKRPEEHATTSWDEFVKTVPSELVFQNRIRTDICCPKCGKNIYKRTDIVLTSYPAQYQYECECGWVGYAHV